MLVQRRTSDKDGKQAVEITYTAEGREGPFTPRQIVAMLSGTGVYPSKWEIMKWKGVVNLQPTSIRLTWNDGLPEPQAAEQHFIHGGDRPGVTFGPGVEVGEGAGEKYSGPGA